MVNPALIKTNTRCSEKVSVSCPIEDNVYDLLIPCVIEGNIDIDLYLLQKSESQNNIFMKYYSTETMAKRNQLLKTKYAKFSIHVIISGNDVNIYWFCVGRQKKMVTLVRELPAVTGDAQIITIGKQIVMT